MKMSKIIIILSVAFLLSLFKSEARDPAEFITPALMFPSKILLDETPDALVHASMTQMKQLASGDAVAASAWIPGATADRPICRASSIIGRLGMKAAYFLSVSKGAFSGEDNSEYYLISGVFVKNNGMSPFIYDPAKSEKLGLAPETPIGYGRTFFIDLWKQNNDGWEMYPIPFQSGVISESFLSRHAPDKNMIWLTHQELSDLQSIDQKEVYRKQK